MENALRSGHVSRKRFLHSLARCGEKDAPYNSSGEAALGSYEEQGTKSV